MNTQFILSFALLYAATIALYISILYALDMRKKRKAAKIKKQNKKEL